jgi:hypothetical protein
MTDIRPIRGTDVPSQDRQAPAEAEPSQCRALVATGAVAAREPLRTTPANRSSAAFLAHLIATADGAPQTREKRRLEPDEASRLYAAAQTATHPRHVRLASL